MRPEVLNGVGWSFPDSTGQYVRATVDHAPYELEDPVYETGVGGILTFHGDMRRLSRM